MISTSTYRIQLHDKFNFHQLESILEYLHELGISTIYASPITRAIKGSSHGYDVTDPQQISPEIGTEEDLQRIAAILVKHNMTWIQDLVPNHMAFENSNPWIRDLLEKGKASEYYDFFDIETDASIELLDGKLMVPFLGNTLTECLQKKEIQLAFTGEGFVIRYFQKEYPVAIPSYRWICTARSGAPPSLLTTLDDLEQKPCRHGESRSDCGQRARSRPNRQRTRGHPPRGRDGTGIQTRLRPRFLDWLPIQPAQLAGAEGLASAR